MNLLVLLTMIILTPPTISQSYQMIVTYGVPASSIFTQLNLSWTECLQECLNTPSCVVVFKNSEKLCSFYESDYLDGVKKVPSSMKKIVGFKILTDSECAPQSTAPIVNGASAMTSTIVIPFDNNAVYTKLAINFIGDSWVFQKIEKYVCPTYFKTFRRGDISWCMNVTWYPTLMIDHNYSKEVCDYIYGLGNVTRSGIQNKEEYDWVKEYLISAEIEMGTKIGFWMSGIRKATCTYPVNQNCNGSNEFTFDDPTLQLPPYLEWGVGEPSGLHNSKGPEDCLVFQSANGTVSVNDYTCDDIRFNGVMMRGVVCGTEPIQVFD